MNSISVRIHVHEDGVEHDDANKLPPAESYALNEGFFPDCQRIGAFLREHNGPMPSTAKADLAEPFAAAMASSASGDDPKEPGLFNVEPSVQDDARVDVLTDTYLRLVTQRGLRRSGPPSQSDGSEWSRNRREHSSDVVPGSHEAQKQSPVTPVSSRDSGLDMFGWDPDPNTARIPLVDAWLDIDKHLTEGDIASPLELQKEIERITLIISRGLARFASAQKTSEQIQEEHPVSDSDLPMGPGELEETDDCVRALDGLWQDLRARFENSPSSGGPPFPVLTISASADLGDVVSVPPLSAEAGICPLSEDDTIPPPDDVVAGPDTLRQVY